MCAQLLEICSKAASSSEPWFFGLGAVGECLGGRALICKGSIAQPILMGEGKVGDAEWPAWQPLLSASFPPTPRTHLGTAL